MTVNRMENHRSYAHPDRNQLGRSMMNLRSMSGAGPRWPWPRCPRGESGGGSVALASAAPLIALALAVAADHAHVSRFRTQVQLAADTASFAVASAIARHPDTAGDGLANRVAA